MALIENNAEINALMESIMPYMGDGICDEDIHETVSSVTIKYENLGKILEYITNQKKYIVSEFSKYTINIMKKNIETFVDSEMYAPNFACIVSNGETITLEMPSIDQFIDFIDLNKNNKYIYLPLRFYNRITCGHIGAIIIDQKEKTVYLFDPNGKTTYFDDVIALYFEKNMKSEIDSGQISSDLKKEMYIDSQSMIDDLINKYVDDVNMIYNKNYTYIRSTVWNPHEYCLNKKLPETYVMPSGNCAIITLLMIHLLHSTEKDMYDLFSNLGQLNDNILLEIINGYSVGMSEITYSIM